MARERKSISKEWLQNLGINNVTEDGKVFYKGKELHQYTATCKHKHGKDKKYPVLVIYDPELFKRQKEADSKFKTGQMSLLVSRIVYAWFNDICPAEYDVDHIDNNPFNNSITNLQLLTRKENLARRLQRNQYNCHLTDEEILYYSDQCNQYRGMIQNCRLDIEEDKKQLKLIQKDLNYYIQLCKDTKSYKLNQIIKDDYTNRINEVKAKLELHRDHWHQWCKKFEEFKTNFHNEHSK